MPGDHLEVRFPKRDLKRVVVKLRRSLAKQASREAREALALLEPWEPTEDYSTPQVIAVILLGPFFDPLVGLLLHRRPFVQPHAESWDDPAWNGANQPVTGISFYEAEAYCRWLSEATGRPFRLPTEAEWEKAARGPDGRIWPWGNTWQEGHCNSKEAGLRRPSPVGSYPGGVSPYEVLDMAGNAWEWCASRRTATYPWRKPKVGERLLDTLLWGVNTRVLRGGSYFNDSKLVRGAYRLNFNPRLRHNNRGLRVASDGPLRGSDE
jgi:formylglycine-generating enzyme required for sulfatase activity